MRGNLLGAWIFAIALAGCGEDTPDAPHGPPGADRIGLAGASASYYWLEDAATGGDHLEFLLGRSHRAMSGPFPVAGDFDGDGFDTVGYYSLVDAVFHLRNDNTDGPDDLTIPLGETLNLPIVGDFNGDGVDTVGVYDVATATFTLVDENGPGAPASTFTLGPPGEAYPVAGDFDGDGDDDVGVYAGPSGSFLLRGVGSGGADLEVPFAAPAEAGVIPFTGDFDGDDVDDLAFSAASTQTIRWRPVASGRERELQRGSRAFAWFPLAGQWEPAEAPPRRDGFAWPTSTPAAQGIDEAALEGAFDHARGLPYIHSLLVVRHGQLVGEEYFNDYRADYPQCIKSVSKSVLSALYGIAFERGDLTAPTQYVADLLPEYFPADVDPEKLDMQLQHLLTMTAGLDWTENEPVEGFQFSIAEDLVGYVLGRDLLAPPGAMFEYSTGLTHVAAEILTRAAGRPLDEYAREHLFAPLGIEPQRWDHAPNGTMFGGAEVWMPPRDLARFGELYLRRGTLDGQSLVYPEWVDGTTVDLVGGYGGWWWIDTFAGHPTYFAWGYGGQFIFVLGDLDLVVVITSDWTLEGAALDESTANAFALLEERILPAVLP